MIYLQVWQKIIFIYMLVNNKAESHNFVTRSSTYIDIHQVIMSHTEKYKGMYRLDGCRVKIFLQTFYLGKLIYILVNVL